MNTLSYKIDAILNKYQGTLIGLAVGDALGAPIEFWRREKIEEYYKKKDLEMKPFERGGTTYPVGFYTDDTAQMICLAESLIEKGFDLPDQYQRYQKWFLQGYATPNEDKSYGIGQTTLRSLLGGKMIDQEKMNGSDKKATGNGSLMRCAPIGLYYSNNLDEIKTKSLLASYVTHNNIIAGWCSVVLNSFISFIIKGVDKRDLQSKVLNKYSDIPEEIIEVLKEDYNRLDKDSISTTGYCIDTLRIAIWSLMTTDNFYKSIKKVLLLGVDTDTFAAVTGALTGCYYGYDGIPEEWKSNLMRADYIKELSEKIYLKK